MRRYVTFDVFTRTQLAGNALAVVHDCAGLDAARMQAIAREFNLSETVFVLPAEKPVHTARVRIFTPAAELPFAGHPTVGAAVAIAMEKAGGGDEMMMVLEEGVGPVRCGVSLHGKSAGHAVFDLPKHPEAIEATFNRDAIAAALGLVPAEVGFENHEPAASTAGLPFVFVPVRDLAAIGRASPQAGAWTAALSGAASAMYLYTRQTVTPGNRFHARCFAFGLGISEDPATGSAVAAFAGIIRRFDALPSGSHRILIEQGVEMKRPSLVALEVDIERGKIAAARIGGDAVKVTEGLLAA